MKTGKIDVKTVKLICVFKEGMGNPDAGKHFAEQRLKKLRNGICFVKFYNGYYTALKENGKIRDFTDKEWEEFVKRLNKERK